MIEWAVYIVVALASITVVQTTQGVLDTGLKRAVTGSGLSYGGFTILDNYTNVISFYEVSAQGDLGLAGFVFIAGSVAVALVWVSNLYKFRQAIM